MDWRVLLSLEFDATAISGDGLKPCVIPVYRPARSTDLAGPVE